MSLEDSELRKKPDFQVVVHRPGKVGVDVTLALMDVYDIAINSMDFGSGMLSTEEVGDLRALGEAIGAERFDYQHDKCLVCGHEFERHWDGTAGKGCGALGWDKSDGNKGICQCPSYARPA